MTDSEMKKELTRISAEIEAEAIQMRLDYERNPSDMPSGSVIEVHEDSPLLDGEDKKLGDVAVQIKRKAKNRRK
jgi:hypothetical protein|tara:strand:+ start:438 stop:659 length:222 start_codon:yes stop_codon:yes gene_type:complete